MPDLTIELGEATLDVLERMAYLFGYPAAAEHLAEPLAPLRGRISYRGAVQGVLEVVTSAELALALAAGVLGRAREELDETHARAALAELLNVLLGGLREWVGPMATVLESGLPEVAPSATAADWAELLARPGVVVLEVEGEPFALTLSCVTVSEETR